MIGFFALRVLCAAFPAWSLLLPPLPTAIYLCSAGVLGVKVAHAVRQDFPVARKSSVPVWMAAQRPSFDTESGLQPRISGARSVGMSQPVGIMGSEGGTATVDDREAIGMTDHNGVLMMQRVLLAGTLGLTMAQKAATILEGEPNQGASLRPGCDSAEHPRDGAQDPQNAGDIGDQQGSEGAVVLRAILDAANECLGHFDDRPPAERWCDTLFRLLDLAAFASELD